MLKDQEAKNEYFFIKMAEENRINTNYQFIRISIPHTMDKTYRLLKGVKNRSSSIELKRELEGDKEPPTDSDVTRGLAGLL